ncbi:alpha-L-arabinofuranosidase [Chlorella sorokiniana]|uniref:Alpha-L-arabinofuranosidase n=1 Tax=Chlorella sorokiniana TaxID=3076 RepID=A0A2P6U4T1_CHLSO|nr:alpha-L-arabinofuranosidase [Chlorella sorokiniana]|eukprot:PRW61314.1 alpha-L-arabinofuranosidase [Chlorella sorokiniana]
MELTASSGQPQLTPASFLEDKQQAFKQVMSSISGQPVEWIEVSAKWGQQTTVLVLSQIHAPLDQLPGVREKLEAAVASQTLEVQLQAIQLDLVPGTVSYTRNGTEDAFAPPPRPPPGSAQQQPPPPPGGGQGADAGGSSSNSTTIAIVVPVVVVTVLAIAGGGTAVYMRKRRGQQAAAEAAVARQERRASRQRSQAGAAAGLPAAGLGSSSSSGPANPSSLV